MASYDQDHDGRMNIAGLMHQQWLERSAGSIERTAELERAHAALTSSADRMLALIGGPGSGKTTFAAQYVRAYRDAYRGGIEYRTGRGEPDVHLLPPRTDHPALIVFDGLDETWIGLEPTLSMLRASVQLNPRLRVLMTSRLIPGLDGLPRVELGEMNRRDIARLIAGLSNMAGAVPEALISQAQGNPLLAELIARATLDRGDWASRLASLSSFGYPGLVDPRGAPLTASSSQGRAFISDVREVNDAIMRMLHQDPDMVYLLPPRRFEEISAELFSRLGYEVELTPATRDGGKDLILVKRGDLGTAVTFVECKNYAPSRPVGVGVVRELYGVVEQGRATSGVVLSTSRFTRGARLAQVELKWRMSLKDYADFKDLLDRAMTPFVAP